MTRMSVSQAAMDFKGTLARVALGERVVLKRGGKPVAAIVPVDDWLRFERWMEEEENRLDLEDARQALAEHRASGEESVPWERIKAEEGL